MRSLEALLGIAVVGSLGYVVSRRLSTDAESEGRPRPGSGPQSTSDSPSHSASETAPGSDSPPGAGRTPQPEPDRTARTDRLTVDEIGSGEFDGVWWPTSATVSEAIPRLVDDLPGGLGRAQRVALPRADWSDEQPKAVTVDGRPLRLAWFDGMRRHTARITFDTDAIVTVLVIPPETEQDAAEAALKAGAAERSRSQLLD